MNTFILGLLTAIPMLLMFRLKSWVISAAILMLLTSVVVSFTTQFHTINQAVSMLTLITSVVLLQQPKILFGDLMALNALLLIHVISAYVPDIYAMVLLCLFVVIYLLRGWVKNKLWLDWLFPVVLSVMWFIVGIHQVWLFAVLLCGLYLLRKQAIMLPNKAA